MELSRDHQSPAPIPEIEKCRVRVLQIPSALSGTFQDQMAAFGLVLGCQLDPPAAPGGHHAAWVLFETPDQAAVRCLDLSFVRLLCLSLSSFHSV